MASKNILTLQVSLPRPRVAKAMHSCAAAKTLALRASFGEILNAQLMIYTQTIPGIRDPRFIREFKAEHCVEVFAEHLPTKKKYVMTY